MKTYKEEESICYLGEMKEKSKVKIIFTLFSSLVREIKPGCGCTKVKQKDNLLEVLFEVGKIPKHLSSIDKQPFKKSILVEYKQEVPQILYIRGFRIR